VLQCVVVLMAVDLAGGADCRPSGVLADFAICWVVNAPVLQGDAECCRLLQFAIAVDQCRFVNPGYCRVLQGVAVRNRRGSMPSCKCRSCRGVVSVASVASILKFAGTADND